MTSVNLSGVGSPNSTLTCKYFLNDMSASLKISWLYFTSESILRAAKRKSVLKLENRIVRNGSAIINVDFLINYSDFYLGLKVVTTIFRHPPPTFRISIVSCLSILTIFFFNIFVHFPYFMQGDFVFSWPHGPWIMLLVTIL